MNCKRSRNRKFRCIQSSKHKELRADFQNILQLKESALTKQTIFYNSSRPAATFFFLKKNLCRKLSTIENTKSILNFTHGIYFQRIRNKEIFIFPRICSGLASIYHHGKMIKLIFYYLY